MTGTGTALYMPQAAVGLVLVLLLAACSESPAFSVTDRDAETGRWYSSALLSEGESVYQANCLICHKEKASGIPAWKKPLADGSYPPPPLDGSAHAWHHSLPVLLKTIEDGGAAFGGKMPPFKNHLSTQEKLAAIAYFQNFWSDEIYQRWLGSQQ